MIIQIEDIYFNPTQIQTIEQDENRVIVNMLGRELIFHGWTRENFAAEVNRCIEQMLHQTPLWLQPTIAPPQKPNKPIPTSTPQTTKPISP